MLGFYPVLKPTNLWLKIAGRFYRQIYLIGVKKLIFHISLRNVFFPAFHGLANVKIKSV